MKQRVIMLFAFILFIQLFGCGHTQGSERVNSYTASKAMFDQIIDALDNEDNEALKRLYAKRAIDEADDIDKQIAELMALYQGKMVSENLSRTSYSRAQMAAGRYIYMVVTPIVEELVTNIATYRLNFVSVPVDVKATEDEGLWRVTLRLKDGDEIVNVCVAGVAYPGDES